MILLSKRFKLIEKFWLKLYKYNWLIISNFTGWHVFIIDCGRYGSIQNEMGLYYLSIQFITQEIWVKNIIALIPKI